MIIAVVLAGLVYIIERPDKEQLSDFKSFKLFPNITNISKIEVEHLMSGSVLTKQGDAWRVAELQTTLDKKMAEQGAGPTISDKTYKVDPEKIARAIESLGKLEAKEHISSNPEKQAIYQVNNIGERVKLYDPAGKIVAEFYVGKTGPDMFTNYVRREGENEVYLTSQIAGVLPADVMSWRDLKIWALDPATITEISFQKNKLVKDEAGEWHNDSATGTVLDAEKVRKFIEQITPISATRFAMVTKPTDTGFDKPQMELMVKAGDQEKKLIVGKADPEGFIYAEVDGGEDTYLLSSDFMKKFSDFDQK